VQHTLGNEQIWQCRNSRYLHLQAIIQWFVELTRCD